MISVPYEVKKALRDGMLRKNYRFVVLNDDGTEDFTIDNDTLVSESVNIDERMCSGDTLKFGLCEGSSLEFQYFDHPNITGRRVQVFVDVQCVDDTSYYTIGELVANGAAFTVTETCNYQFTIPANVSGLIVRYDTNGIEKAQQSRPARQEPWLIVMSANVGDYFLLTSTYSYSAPIGMEGSHYRYPIPMGFFDVKKCSRQASTGIMKVTAYNKLMSDYLDAKANETILDIVSQGEAGQSSVSVYYLLKQLLEGYSIETYTRETEYIDISDSALDSDSTFEYWLRQHASGTIWELAELCFPLYDTSTHAFTSSYLHITSFTLAMGGGSGDLGYYTQFLLNGEAAKYITENTYVANIRYYLDSLSVRGIDDSGYKTLREFLLNGDCLTFWAFQAAQSSFDMQKYIVGGQIGEQTRSEYLINIDSDYMTEINYISSSSDVSLVLPYRAVITNSTTDVRNVEDFKTYFRPMHHTLDWFYKSYKLDIPELSLQRITEAQAEAFSDVTLRDIQTAVYESACQFGQLSRVTDLFSGVELNHSRLYPADTLYPATDLYPDGAALSGFKSMYSKLWADEGNVHKWRYLIITYKGLDEEQNEKDYTLQRTVNADGTDDYNMSDNWLFRNLVWTAADVGDYADAMVAKMQDVTWFPFEMWCAGLPYLETGDEIEIPLNGESYTSYVLQRQLKGIQNLQDTYINGTLDIF